MIGRCPSVPPHSLKVAVLPAVNQLAAGSHPRTPDQHQAGAKHRYPVATTTKTAIGKGGYMHGNMLLPKLIYISKQYLRQWKNGYSKAFCGCFKNKCFTSQLCASRAAGWS